jgi:hypothetical protein
MPENLQNLYKYFVAPLATYYGKKKTDLVEKVDPLKERTWGELEAALAVKQASILKASAAIAEKLPQIDSLRVEVVRSEEERRRAVARASTLAQLRVSGSIPDKVQYKFLEGSCLEHNDLMTVAQPPAGTASQQMIRKLIDFDVIPPYPQLVDPMTITPIMKSIVAAEESWDGVAALPDAFVDNNVSLAPLAAYMCYRFASLQQRVTFTPDVIVPLCFELEGLIRSPCEFFAAKRCLLTSASFLFMLCKGGLHQKLSLRGDLVLTAVLASASAFLHHVGVSNHTIAEAGTFLSHLFPDAPTQRHSASCAVEVLRRHQIPSTICCVTTLATMVASLSEFDPPSSSALTMFKLRALEIKDFSRSRSDKVMALCATLSLCSMAHMMVPASHDWEVVQLDASRLQVRLSERYGLGHSLHHTWWDDSEGKLRGLVDAFAIPFPKILPSFHSDQPGMLVQAPSVFM